MTKEEGSLNQCGPLNGDLEGRKKLIPPGIRGHVF